MQHDYSLGKKLHPKENLTQKSLDLLSKKTPKSRWLIGVSPLALAACGGSSSESSLTLRTGTAGADTFPNSRANERFEGGLGDDIYQLNYGGQDEIVDFGGIDEIIIPFNEVNNHTRKSLERIGDNLVITQIDGSSITIYNQFSGNTSIEYLNYYLDGNSIGREKIGGLNLESVSETELNLLIGSNADETFSYNGSAVLSIWANDGNNTITTGAAGDCIRTGDGNDIINAGGGDDQVFAGDGNDVIQGGDGDDTIEGGDGDDFIEGGNGADTFVFNINETGTDIIADFSLLAGDKLDLTSYGIYTELAARALMSNVSTGVNITISGSIILTINGITINEFTLADGWLVSVRDTAATVIGGGVATTVTTRPTTEFSFSTDRGSYVLVADAKTYTEAASYARSELNGTLASFESKSDFDGFYSALQATVAANSLTPTRAEDGGNAKFIWLGATDSITEGSWVWDNGEGNLTYTDFWGSGVLGNEPDNNEGLASGRDQDGLAIGMENWPEGRDSGAGYGDAGFWNDVDVANTLYFVVELG